MNIVAKAAVHPRVRAGCEIFVNGRTKQQVASHISSQEGGFGPRTSDSEIDGPGKIARMKVLLRERTGFSDNIAGERKPIPDRTAGNVQELAKQILIHIERVERIATQGELQAWRDTEAYISQPQHRSHAEI